MACSWALDGWHGRVLESQDDDQRGGGVSRRRGSDFVFILSLIAFQLILVASAWSQSLPSIEAKAPPFSLVATRLPVGNGSDKLETIASGTLRAPWGDGASLVLFSGPGRPARLLAPGFHSSADPDVSFDGKRVLFAGKRNASDRWAIYEATVASGEIRRITDRRGDCRSPCYQGSMYTITEEAPWRQITFVETDGRTVNEFGVGGASAIYSCKLDGSFVQRLTYNLSSDYDPVIMPDGRLVFASWQRSGWHHGPLGRITLLGINTDGIDFAPFCGEVGRRIKQMPCVTTRGLAVFVEADSVAWDGAGQLSCVSLRRPLHSYRSITRADEGLFHSPSPLPDGRILVSRRPADGSAPHAVCSLDPETKRLEVVLEEAGCHWLQAKVVAPREEPDGRSSVLTPEDPLGKFYCLDVYQTDLKDPKWMPRGCVKKVRVVEGVPRGPGDPSTPASVPQLAARRILGETSLAADGSFNIEVPANLPIQLQLLDDKGMALRSCGWIWTRNHAAQGCIGCHEDPELTPINRVADAVAADSVPLHPPVERRQSVDFRRDVMPMIAKKCAGCHAADGSPPRLDGGSTGAEGVYAALLAREEASGAGPRWKYVYPGQARTSPLVWHLVGANTSRPWDGPAARQPVKPIPADKAPALSAEEMDLLVRWIDLGARWQSD